MGRQWHWLALAASLGGCSDEAPQGQVIARVNGMDITRRELMTEVRAQGNVATRDVAAVQGLLVQRLIDRKLLAAEARKALVDRSPDYQAERRRMEEILLANQMATRLSGQIAEPGPASIDRYIANNPHMFAQRESLLVDQLDFDPRAAEAVPGLGRMPTIDAMAKALSAAGMMAHRHEVMLDSRAATAEGARLLHEWRVGDVMLVRGGAQALIARRSSSSDREEQRRAARMALMQQAQADMVEALAIRLRRDATIGYQPGFAPAVKP
ncbi:hypothetical protein ACFOKF_07990 [Sphingobium rhizovicinum]|uniref:Peptidyl-prolyl cis-trans isomerase, EpsD family n=1 Tax=Sphingobium rhizovicinum TaxID=432308 RepID=A0ABV7NDN3_9SPHN